MVTNTSMVTGDAGDPQEGAPAELGGAGRPSELEYWDRPVSMAQAISETLGAYGRTVDAERSGPDGTRWGERWGSVLDAIERELPRGSGIDAGTTILRDFADSIRWNTDPAGTWDPDTMFALTAGWHAMDSNGYYTGWFDFRIVVRATFGGPVVDIEWVNGSPEQDYDAEQIPCGDCGGTGERTAGNDAELDLGGELDDDAECSACGGTGQVDDGDAEWAGISDPGDYLGDVYREAMRELVTRGDFDSGAGDA